MYHSSIALLAALPMAIAPQVSHPTELTLGQVIQLARTHSLQVAVSKERLSSASALQEAANAPLRPNVTLQSSANYGLGAQIPGSPVLGAGMVSGVGISYLLFDGNGSKSALDVATAQTDSARIALEQTEQNAIASAAVDYFEVLRATGLARVARETYQQAQDHLKLGEMRFKAGTSTRADLLQLQAELANAQVNVIQTQNAVETSRLTLANALSTPLGNRPLDASASVPLRPVSLEAAMPKALTRRQDLRIQELKIASDRDRITQLSSARWPNISANGRYGLAGTSTSETYAGLTFSWDVFDGDKAESQAQSAKFDAQADTAQLDLLKQGAELEIRQSYLTRQEARERQLAARNGLEAAREAYAIARSRFELGLSTQFELTDVQNTLIQAENNEVIARTDLMEAEIRLERALGDDLTKLGS